MRNAAILALLLASAAAGAAEQTRALPAFDRIRCEGPVNIVVEVGKSQAMLVAGSPEYLKKVETRVVGGELRITMEEEENGQHMDVKDGDQVTVRLPALQAFHVKGAGQAIINDVAADRLSLRFLGAGRLAVNGQVKHLSLSAQGVGEVDTRALKAEHADVSFGGIGGVKVYASQRLDANVMDMGSLEYYGKPAKVNKTVVGLGNVTARD